MAERPASEPADAWIALCNSADLVNGGKAVPFDVNFAGQTCTAFAIRYQGQPHAYLNRCTHVAMPLDWQPGQVFDATGRWLLCATHGAAYEPASGQCSGGPCRGGLVKIELIEQGGVVHWQSTYRLKPLNF
jgi:nitrite reductase/ring-hydroxylating ferredoxin subunit